VYVALAAKGCQEAQKKLDKSTRKNTANYMAPLQGDPDYYNMEPEKKKKLVLGFWRRKEHEGD
jgi:hypothetical protein